MSKFFQSKSGQTLPSQLAATLAVWTFVTMGVFVTTCQAQPAVGSHGRTKDGKPFRIDQEGLRISDYIAELEVANDDLKRQLESAERELDEKDRLLGHGGSRPKSDVKERDLVDYNGASSCDARLKDAQTRLAAAEQSAKNQLQPACDFQSPANPYKAQVSELQARMLQAPGAEDVRVEQEKRVAAESELARAKEELSSSRERLVKLEKDAQEIQLSRKEESVPSRAALREIPKEEPKVEKEVIKEEPKRAEVSPSGAGEPADASTKAELRAAISQIQKLVGERKNLLDAMKSKGKAVSISLRPLVTAGGKSLDSFRIDVEHFSSAGEGDKIRSGLAEISAILTDDISLLKRLTK